MDLRRSSVRESPRLLVVCRALVVATPLLLLHVGALGQIASEMRPPADWGPLAPAGSDGSGCPQLEGVYSKAGERYFVEVNNGKESTGRKPTAAPIWSGHRRLRGPAARTVLPLQPGDAARIEMFWVVGNPPGRLDIRWLSRDKRDVEAIALQPDAGDFACAEGTIVLAVEDSGGYKYGDGVATKTTARTRIARATDGALIYHRTLAASGRSLGVTTGELTVDEYYRFPAVANEPGMK